MTTMPATLVAHDAAAAERTPVWIWTIGLSVAAMAALAVAVGPRMVVLVAAGAVLAGAFLYPRVGLLLLVAVPMLFREETWYLRYVPVAYGGTEAAVLSFYDQRVFAVSFASLLVIVLVLRSLLARPEHAERVYGAFAFWLVVLLIADVGAELVGRMTVGPGGALLGQWSQVALPIVAALLVPVWCERSQLHRAIDVLALLAAGRLVFGLVRYAAGGGDWHFEIGRRIVFWDSADGLLGVFVASIGLVAVLDGNADRRRRVLGGALVALGVVVVALCLRRQAMGALTVALPLTMFLLRRRTLLIVSLIIVTVVVAVIVALDVTAVRESVFATRAQSVVRLRDENVSTNVWHLRDLEDGLLNIADNPILGYGYYSSPPRRTYELSSRDVSLAVIGVYHNMFVNTWFRMGLVGVVALILILYLGLRDGGRAALWRGDPRAAGLTATLSSMVCAGFFGSTLTTERAPYFLMLGLAALVVLGRGAMRPEEPTAESRL